MRSSLFLLLFATGALAGCDLFGADFDDLDLGTFRMEANGETVTGTATYFRDRFLVVDDSARALRPLLSLDTGDGDLLTMKDDDLRSVRAGDELHIGAGYSFSGGTAGYDISESGTVRITYTDSTRIEGTFRFRMRDEGGALSVRKYTIEGGFNAPLAEPVFHELLSAVSQV